MKDMRIHSSGTRSALGNTGALRKRASRQVKQAGQARQAGQAVPVMQVGSRVAERDGDGVVLLPVRRPHQPLPAQQAQFDLEHLARMPFGKFAGIVADLLVSMGYEDVRLVGRAAGGGRNGTGGYDLRCTVAGTGLGSASGASRRTVLVLLKQFGRNAWVFQRMVDELRGVAVREGADEAILITTGKLSPVIAQCEGVAGADPASQTLPPVERIGGDRLRWLFAAYGIKIPHAIIPEKDLRAVKPAGSVIPPISPLAPELPFSKRLTSPASPGKAPTASIPPTRRRETLPQSSAEQMPGCVVTLEVHITITR